MRSELGCVPRPAVDNALILIDKHRKNISASNVIIRKLASGELEREKLTSEEAQFINF